MTEKDIEAAAWCNADFLDMEKARGCSTLQTDVQAFIDGINFFKKAMWHDGSEEPKKNGMYLVYASYEYEEYPEDNYSEYTTSAWLGGSWTEDHFPSEADVTIKKWCNIEDITL